MTAWDKVLAIGSVLVTIGTTAWGAWKKVVKPIMAYVKEYEQLKKDAARVLVVEKRQEYLDKKLDSMIYLSGKPMLVCDEEGLCIMANQAALELFGARTEAQMKGFGFMQFIKDTDRARIESDLRTNIRSGAEDFKSSYCLIHGDTEEEVEVVYHLLIGRDDNNQVLVAIAKVTKAN